MDKRVYITAENGEETVMDILFSFEDEKQQEFAFFTDPQDSEEVYAFKILNAKELVPVEDEAEMQMCREVFAAYEDENVEEEETNI